MSADHDKILKENSALKAQVEALKAEVDLLRNNYLQQENSYKDRYYRVNENVNDVIYRFRFDDRKYEYISPQVEGLFGYPAQAFYDNPALIRHIIHPDCIGDYIRNWHNIFKGDIPEYFEMKVMKKSGEVRWVMQKNLAIRDDEGNVTELEGVVTDITERKLAEQALIESEAQKNAILNNFPHLAWMKDINGVYLSVNETFAKKYNQSIDEVIGKKDSDIYPLDIAKNYSDSDRQVIESKKQIMLEETTQGTFWETIKSPIFNTEGDVIGVTGVSLEITEHRKKEEEIKDYSEQLAMQNVKLKLINDELTQAKEKAEKADRLKSSFLANMSHEIRTPMNAILGFATLLRDRKLPQEKQRDFINLINANSRQLLHIISDIIDISKIESDQITIFKKDFNINKMLNVLKLNFEEVVKAERKDIVIALDAALPDEEAQYNSDKVRMEQILSNLLSNAVKFCEKGKITCGYEISGSKIKFFVRDTGIGMTKEEQSVIFDRFRQVSSSYNKLYGGTGLGLSISKGLADRLGGVIAVESEEGVGSTFSLSLPYKKSTQVRPEKIEYNNRYSWSGRTILIAEDEKANYTLLESIIFPTKAKIIWVKNGLEAVQACENNETINLVLMDIKMPEMNGLDATKLIRKNNKQLPIIAQTAFAMPQDADNCLRAGCTDYLAKPLQVEDILNKISKYIQVGHNKDKIYSK